MRELDRDKTIEQLNGIMEFELAGVVRYTHYSLMVTVHRIPIVQFFPDSPRNPSPTRNKLGKFSPV